MNENSRFGAPVELNYAAMTSSMCVRIVERIPTIKNLIKRLNQDFLFKLECGFLVSDKTPSEAAYSRLLTKLSESNVLEKAQNSLVYQAITEGFISDDTVAIDATHFEASDKAPLKTNSLKLNRKNEDASSK